MESVAAETLTRVVIPRQPLHAGLLAAVVLGSLLLNVCVPPSAPIHGNTHGYQTIRTILQPRSEINEKQFYGTVYVRFMRVVCSTFGRGEETIYRTNALFGALAVWALFVLACAVGISTDGALVAALIMALQPSHVWLSGSEFPMALFQCLSLWGLGLAAFACSSARGVWLWPAALLVGMACRVHALTVLMLPVLIGVVAHGLYRGRLKERRALWPHLAGAMFICTFLVATQAR